MTTQYNHLIVLPTHQAFMFHHYQPVHYIYTSFTQSVLIVIKAHVFSLMHLKVCWLGICLKCFANLFYANLNIFLVPEFHFIVCNINTNFIITINTLFFEQQQSMSYKHSSMASDTTKRVNTGIIRKQLFTSLYSDE